MKEGAYHYSHAYPFYSHAYPFYSHASQFYSQTCISILFTNMHLHSIHMHPHSLCHQRIDRSLQSLFSCNAVLHLNAFSLILFTFLWDECLRWLSTMWCLTMCQQHGRTLPSFSLSFFTLPKSNCPYKIPVNVPVVIDVEVFRGLSRPEYRTDSKHKPKRPLYF